MSTQADSFVAELAQFGVLGVTGAEARAFLHGQLTNDVEHLAPGRACRAGWCSAKGRLLATLLVVPHQGGYLLQLSRDLAPAVAKRLSMFVLRAKVRITDESDAWRQYGIWGAQPENRFSELGTIVPTADLDISRNDRWTAIRVGQGRFIVFGKEPLEADAPEEDWSLEEIRAGRPHVTQATQDQFVPQMVNFDRIGAVDFRKGCYPGQEIVARAQYRGQVKRRMARIRSNVPLRPAQEIFSGTEPVGAVVNAAGHEALAVLQVSTLEEKAAIRTRDGAALDVLPLPYPIT
jgi:hypothetical protein